MAVEMALLTPAFALLMLFIAGAGRIVEAQGQVDGAARDAARAASIQRDGGQVSNAVYQAAYADLNPGNHPMCPDGMQTNWNGGPATGNVQATVHCTINLMVVSGFGQVTLTGNAAAPLDTFMQRTNWP
jgi:Flp pilus assembly protein TadG